MPARLSVGRAGAAAVLGLTVPLLAVGTLRLQVGGDGLPIIVCVLLAGAGLFGLRYIFGTVSIADSLGADARFLALSMLAFWTWHLFAAMRSIAFESAMLEHARLTVGMVCFAALVGSRRLLSGYVGHLWTTSIVVSALLLAALMFRYAVVFGMPYLGNDWEIPTRLGKNQLGWFLAVTMPYVLVNFMCSGRGWRYLVPTLIHVLAWVYVASRGSWICGVMGTALALGFSRGNGMRKRICGRTLLLMAILVAAAALFLSVSKSPIKLDDLDVVVRLMDSGSLSPAQHSNKLRLDLIKYYAELFERSPLIGIGLRNSIYAGGYVSHNDILAILAEQGLFGIVLFAVVILGAVRAVFAGPALRWYEMASRGAAVSVVLYLLLINAYASPMFWILLALITVSSGERCHIRMSMESSGGDVCMTPGRRM